MSCFNLTALCAFGVVVVAWLAVSFMSPGRPRATGVWIATIALYASLFAFFLGNSLGAWSEGKTAPLVAFGFLCALFALGLVVSLGRFVAHLTGAKGSGERVAN